ncbi:MAG: hypothetical protein JOZ90_13320 [Alphaproteobacteria bacterium]|nr:hypothetical protein [Alphaproteobacteria bacterium]MBV9372863.1 hypothetical protein [Alphaproteobacteria bacterium]MBV9902051.1 hypothetical protein [Alphaproteobacteria bacterium]
MDTLTPMIERYQLELGQLRSRAQAFYRQGNEVEAQAKLVEAKIEAISEAKAALEAAAEKPKVRQRNRPLSGPWKAIMAQAADVHSFDYDNLERFAAEIGHEVNRDTLRSQMSGYKGLGLVESLGGGKFSVTSAGREAAGLPERETAREEQEERDAAPTSHAGRRWGGAADLMYTLNPSSEVRRV